MNKIISDFGKGLKQLGEETGKELINQTGKIAESIITGKELLGDIVPMGEQEMEQKKKEDEGKKQKEISDVRCQISGRNVEAEMEQIRNEKEEKEKEEERLFLENLKRQREEERAEMESMVVEPESKRSRGKTVAGNKAKKEDMSQTREYIKKPD